MVVINSNQRKPIFLYIGFLFFCICFFLWPLRAPNNNSNGSRKSSSLVSHPSMLHHPNLPDVNDPPAWQNTTRVKAAFVILTRNNELDALRKTIQQLEARFNHKFNYPYVFLNDVEFTEEFIELTSSLTNAETKYGLIPKEHWSYPDWIDIEKADRLRKEMEEKGIIYGGSLSYRHMCRFNSGFFYKHPLLQDYEYYWRVEPSVEFYCDIDYDPFLYMKENNKKYGWTISLIEFEATIPTLWETTKQFIKENRELIAKNNLIDFISNDNGNSYNLCHFWSNFEIGDLKFLRSPEYTAFFDYLDKSGGFFYERWGDAPVHSIAVGLFLNKSEVQFFNDIGYKHDPFIHCPVARELQLKCHCNAEDNFDLTPNSCMRRWVELR